MGFMDGLEKLAHAIVFVISFILIFIISYILIILIPAYPV